MLNIDYDPAAPQIGDLYTSNYGDGPLAARIIAVDGGVVSMERWHFNRPDTKVRFALTLEYLFTNSGWRETAEGSLPQPGLRPLDSPITDDDERRTVFQRRDGDLVFVAEAHDAPSSWKWRQMGTKVTVTEWGAVNAHRNSKWDLVGRVLPNPTED